MWTNPITKLLNSKSQRRKKKNESGSKTHNRSKARNTKLANQHSHWLCTWLTGKNHCDWLKHVNCVFVTKTKASLHKLSKTLLASIPTSPLASSESLCICRGEESTWSAFNSALHSKLILKIFSISGRLSVCGEEKSDVKGALLRYLETL